MCQLSISKHKYTSKCGIITVTKLALDFNRRKVTHLWHRFICHTWFGTCIQGTCIHTRFIWPSLTYAYTRHPFDIISPIFIFDLLTMAVARLILMEKSSKTGWSWYCQIEPRVKMPGLTDRMFLPKNDFSQLVVLN